MHSCEWNRDDRFPALRQDYVVNFQISEKRSVDGAYLYRTPISLRELLDYSRPRQLVCSPGLADDQEGRDDGDDEKDHRYNRASRLSPDRSHRNDLVRSTGRC